MVESDRIAQESNEMLLRIFVSAVGFDYIAHHENFIGFLMGNVIKYRHKNGIEDLKKARWYLDRAIKEVEQNDER